MAPTLPPHQVVFAQPGEKHDGSSVMPLQAVGTGCWAPSLAAHSLPAAQGSAITAFSCPKSPALITVVPLQLQFQAKVLPYHRLAVLERDKQT